jgi:hypothetical protein
VTGAHTVELFADSNLYSKRFTRFYRCWDGDDGGVRFFKRSFD